MWGGGKGPGAFLLPCRVPLFLAAPSTTLSRSDFGGAQLCHPPNPPPHEVEHLSPSLGQFPPFAGPKHPSRARERQRCCTSASVCTPGASGHGSRAPSGRAVATRLPPSRSNREQGEAGHAARASPRQRWGRSTPASSRSSLTKYCRMNMYDMNRI